MYVAYVCIYGNWQIRLMWHGYNGLHYRTESFWMVPGTVDCGEAS